MSPAAVLVEDRLCLLVKLGMVTSDSSCYPRRKRIRLDAECYGQANTICSVTIAVQYPFSGSLEFV